MTQISRDVGSQQDANEMWERAGNSIYTESARISIEPLRWDRYEAMQEVADVHLDRILADHDAARKLEIAREALTRVRNVVGGREPDWASHAHEIARAALALINQDSGDSK